MNALLASIQNDTVFATPVLRAQAVRDVGEGVTPAVVDDGIPQVMTPRHPLFFVATTVETPGMAEA